MMVKPEKTAMPIQLLLVKHSIVMSVERNDRIGSSGFDDAIGVHFHARIASPDTNGWNRRITSMTSRTTSARISCVR